MSVQLTAFVLEPPNKAIKIGGDFQARRARRALYTACPRNQHFEIVHAAEQILGILQRAKTRGRARGSEVLFQLQRVPQFLHRDPNFMKAIGKVKASSVFDRERKPFGALSRAVPGLRSTLRIPDALGCLSFLLARRRHRAFTQLSQIETFKKPLQFRMQLPPFFSNRGAEPLDCGPRHIREVLEFVEDQECHVELADRPKALGQPTDRPGELLGLSPGCDKRQCGSKPPRCHSCLVERGDVTLGGSRQCPPEGGDSLADEVFRGRGTHN